VDIENVTYFVEQFIHYIINELYIFRPRNCTLHPIAYLPITYTFLTIIIPLYCIFHFNLSVGKFFSQMRKMSFADCVNCGVQSRMTNVLLNPKDADRNIDRDTEEKMLLKRIIEQYVKRISVLQRWAELTQLLIVQQPSVFILPPSSNTSTWPPFQYVSMYTSLDQQYENSYYISGR